MSKLRMLLVNEIDAAVLSSGVGTVFSSTLPISNVQQYGNARVARSSTPASVEILGAWTSARWLSGLALYRHNLTATAKFRIELFDSDDQSGVPVFDSELVNALDAKSLSDLDWGIDELGATVFTGWGEAFTNFWFELVAAKSFRITIEDPLNSTIDIARIYLGRYLEPSVNISRGHSNSWRENTEQKRTAGGSLWSHAKLPFRNLRFSLDWLSEDDRTVFMDAIRVVGKRRDIFVSVYPGDGGSKERDYALAGKFTRVPDLVNNQLNNYRSNYEIAEA